MYITSNNCQHDTYLWQCLKICNNLTVFTSKQFLYSVQPKCVLQAFDPGIVWVIVYNCRQFVPLKMCKDLSLISLVVLFHLVILLSAACIWTWLQSSNRPFTFIMKSGKMVIISTAHSLIFFPNKMYSIKYIPFLLIH
jgi:hypothetical protein